MPIKKVGIVRRIDELGRIVIPKEYRRAMMVKEDEPMEIVMEKRNGVSVLVLRKDIEQDEVEIHLRALEFATDNIRPEDQQSCLTAIRTARKVFDLQK